MTSPAPQPADGERLRSRIACGLWIGCGDGMHDYRCPASGQTSPASAEPTEADWETACAATGCDRVTVPIKEGDNVFLLCDEHSGYWPCLAGPLAHALASQRAEIVARYEELAAELQADARERINEGEQGLADSGYALFRAGARIREAAPK